MTTLYLIRHGIVYNPHQILYGRLPGYGLTEVGQEQILQTAEFLSLKHVEKIYASPLLRARQTAEIIERELGIPLETHKALLEVNSSYMGTPFDSFDAIQSEIYLKPLKPSDESLVQVANRMYTFVNELLQKHNGTNIAAVSHGDPIMAIRAKILDLPLDVTAVKAKPYVTHGEVYMITEHEGDLTINSVFAPIF